MAFEYEFLSRIRADPSRVATALRYATVSIRNSNDINSHASQLKDDIDPLAVFTDPPGPRIFISTRVIEKSDELTWYSVVPTEDGNGFYRFRFSHGLFVRALQLRQVYVAQGSPFVPTTAIVIGMKSGDSALFQNVHNTIVHLHSVGNAFFDLDKIVWYVSGDFFWWYDLLTRIDRRLEFFLPMSEERVAKARAIDQRLRGRRLSEDEFPPLAAYEDLSLKELADLETAQSSVVDLDILAMRSSGVAGILLRWFPAGAGGPVFSILEREIESGILRRIKNREARKIYDQVQISLISRLILSSWAAF